MTRGLVVSIRLTVQAHIPHMYIETAVLDIITRLPCFVSEFLINQCSHVLDEVLSLGLLHAQLFQNEINLQHV